MILGPALVPATMLPERQVLVLGRPVVQGNTAHWQNGVFHLSP